jgi:hypothetical protein
VAGLQGRAGGQGRVTGQAVTGLADVTVGAPGVHGVGDGAAGGDVDDP